ncbi:MAG: pilus assembly protein PilP [Pseudomonadota bacterium]|nr:pilus assembly protein PilP [Pseudomonadota bacterium]
MRACVLMSRLMALGAVAVALVGCAGSDPVADLRAYVDEVKTKPSGRVEPLPQFRPYESFAYSAAGKRSPFEQPIEIVVVQQRDSNSQVEPDPNRPREYLENFNITALNMVGVMQRGQARWALIADAEGDIYRVTEGNYLGRNHGKVTAVDEAHIELLEIVPDGQGGWVERPRTLDLREAQ